MTASIQIRISVSDSHPQVVEWNSPEPLVLGRQRQEEALFQIYRENSTSRLPIAHRQQVDISRQQVQLLRTGNKIAVQNLNPGVSVRVDTDPLLPGADNKQEFNLPFVLEIGNCELEFQNNFQTLSAQTRFYQDLPAVPADEKPVVAEKAGEIDSAQLVAFLGRIISVLQQTTTEAKLYELACNAVKQLIRVDGATLLKGDCFEDAYGDTSIKPVQKVLDKVRLERFVCWGVEQHPAAGEGDEQLGNVFYVAAPIVAIRDGEDVVIALLYAHRRIGHEDTAHPFNTLHGQLVELIACSVAAAKVRIDHQRTAGQFEQFFTPALAKKLIHGNELLEAEERDITVLICDIREFSSISEHLTPYNTSEWVQDVLSQLSEVVLNYEGVLVDYIGDELVAMWGAPENQPDHAELACKCAREMITRMPEINDKWLQKIGSETRVGIGINTGVAFVGNTGSTQKFKYGPLGDTVNRASRVQGLTKYLKVDALMTGQTRQQISADFAARRIGKARVVNIQEPIELYQLIIEPFPAADRREKFEEALGKLECGQLSDAADLIKESLDFEHPDHPTLLMLDEIIQRVISGKSAGTYEWTFDKK